MRAMGAAILFVDADGSTPIAELEKLESSTRGQGSIIICGSRTRTQSDLVIKSPLRRFLSTAFAIFLNAICYPQVQDSQCGFKLLTRRAAQLTVPQCTICGWAFDVELLLIARRVGVFVTEVPVRWEERAGSKMFLPRDSFLMAFDVLRMSLCDRIKSAWHQAP
jgi:dolichyl-phosphate beta-glucosyltransferase